ncbi:MAG: hypothetical protein KBG07_06735 [Elusimicrobia bacterium]|nr:hypothetical protein [Elusimicrobiota bacterium]
MKRIATLGAAIIAAAFVENVVHAAVVATKQVDVSATVSGLSDLKTEVKNVADNTDATVMAFPAIAAGEPEWANKPQQYVKVTVDNNSALSWRLRSYTNNFAPIAPADKVAHIALWGEQFGGLKGAVPGAKASLAWLVNPTVIPDGPGVGNPVDGTTNGFTFLKDFQDFDISVTTADDESFAVADAAGYTNMAFGAPSYTRIVRPNVVGGNEPLATRNTPFYYYVEGNFGGAVATTYTTTINFDLINQ